MAQTANDRQASVKKLADLVKDVKYAMLTTRDTDGALRSRPMVTQQAPFDGDVWFFTHASAPKVREIQRDPLVNVSYADPSSNTYVSLSGRAELVRDKAKAKELWNKIYEAWFPKGLDDPELGLIKVSVEQAEYWDSPSSTMVQLAGFLKAKLTGKPFNPGTNEKVKVK